MIFITAKFPVKPEHADDWPEISRAFTEARRAEEGCLWFDWSRSLDDPNEYVLVEAFRDEAAGGAHVQSRTSPRPPRRCPPTCPRRRRSSTRRSRGRSGPSSARWPSRSSRTATPRAGFTLRPTVRYGLPRTHGAPAPRGWQADVAQLVERNLAKVEVAGSSPVVRSAGRARRLTSAGPSARSRVGRRPYAVPGVRRLSLMAAASKAPAVEIEVGDHTVRLSNPDRVYFSERGETKLDLVDYYLSRRRRASSTRCASGRACCTASRRASTGRRCTRSGCPPARRRGWRPCGCTSRATACTPTSCA